MENIFFPAVHECFHPPMYITLLNIIKLRIFVRPLEIGRKMYRMRVMIENVDRV